MGHSSRLTCHPGLSWTLRLHRQCFWWPSHWSSQSASHPLAAVVTQTVDFVTILPPLDGNNAILTSCPLHFSHKTPFHCKDWGTPALTIFSISTVSQKILCQTKDPNSHPIWRAFCAALGASVSLSSGYHPKSNGQVERTKQSL